MISRVVEPELLDELSAHDPSACRSRADLRRLNWLMAHASLIARATRSSPSTKRLCDLGSGDGMLMLRIARQLGWRDVELTLVDKTPLLTSQTRRDFHNLGWQVKERAEDVFTTMRAAPVFDVVTANLFLHHLQPIALRELLALIAGRTQMFVACEPRRSSLALLASRSLGVIGCGPVTRHDAVASVRAGFRDGELSELWPDRERWALKERAAGLFSHLFVAKRL